MTTHLIFGAGLIGGFMAGSFAAGSLAAGSTAKKQRKVIVFGREYLRSRFADTLRVTDYRGNSLETDSIEFHSAIDDLSEHEFDFIWLTVKCTGLEQAIVDLAPIVSENTVIVCCQNGLGSDEIVRSTFPRQRVLRAIMQSNVAHLADAHLHRGSEGTLVIEDFDHHGDNLASSLDSSVLPTQSIEALEEFSWAKLQINLANAVNALANIPVREMLSERPYRRIIALAMKECLAVTNNKQLRLPKVAAVPMHWIPHILALPNWAFEIIGRSMLQVDPTVRTSMWWDLNDKRLTEIDYLNGAVVEHAHALGVPCEVNKKICDWVRRIEKSNARGLARPQFDPKQFLAEIKAAS